MKTNLLTSDYDYDLPEELIAQHPSEKRDHSRLMIVNRETGEISDKNFYDIIEYLNPGDLLVINDTKVIPARLYGSRESTGGKVEILLLKRFDDDIWECLAGPGKKARPGDVIVFSPNLKAKVLSIEEEGVRRIQFEYDGVFEEILSEIGEMPLPPYIHEKLENHDDYQTVYAKYDGSAAAPTAGLHFTPELLEKVKDKGIDITSVTLHVGLGTFRPVKEEDLTNHQMHSEHYFIPEETVAKIRETRNKGGRVIAVGTTSVRALESAVDEEGILQPGENDTEIFIYPGKPIKVVDALITNFHLPKSTLLMLVSALYNREDILRVYEHAIKERYRFFSFGDAMFIE